MRRRILVQGVLACAIAATLAVSVRTQAAIQVAGTLLVDLDARDASAGTATWVNNGSLGDFTEAQGDPVLGLFGTTDQLGVSFTATDAYRGPVSPASITGSSDRTVEVWAFNPTIQDHETMVAWGRRGGPDGSNVSFTYGSNGVHGAVGHWGGPDMGWNGAPAAGTWHHLVYVNDGAQTRVYADGFLRNTETHVLATHAGQTINLGAQNVDVAGNLFAAERFTGALGTVRVHDGALSLSQIRNNYSEDSARFGAPALPAPESAMLVSLWRFDAPHPSNVGLDSAATGNDLTAQGDANNGAAGKYGRGLVLDGAGDMLDSPGGFPIDIPVGNDQYSIAAWIKPDVTGDRGIIGWGNYGTVRTTNALRTFGANGFRHYWWGADLDALDAQVPVDLDGGEWVHVTAVYNGLQRTIYVNGVAIVSDEPGANNAAALNFAIGRTCTFCGGGEFWDGMLDDVAVFKGALSEAQIRTIMGGDYRGFGIPIPEPTTLGLIALGAAALARRRRA